MNALGTRIALVALASTFALASPASGEEPSGELLPPGNSAANQYTEAFPTARGGQDPEQDEGKARHGSSLRALGSRNVRRLEAQGPEGRAAAEVAAATAPSAVAPADSPPETAPQEPRREAKPGEKPRRSTKEQSVGIETAVVVSSADVDPPSGGSGLGEVIGQATGSSASGGLGLWLPLIFIAVLAWAAGYAWSRRGASQQPG